MSFLAVLLGFELERDHKNNKKSHTDTVVLENLNGDAISTSVTEYTYGNDELCTVLHSLDLRETPYVQELGVNYEDEDGNEHQLRMKVGVMERVITDGTDPTATVAAVTSVDGHVSVVLDESGDIRVKRGDASFDTEFVCDAEERRMLQDQRRRLFSFGSMSFATSAPVPKSNSGNIKRTGTGTSTTTTNEDDGSAAGVEQCFNDGEGCDGSVAGVDQCFIHGGDCASCCGACTVTTDLDNRASTETCVCYEASTAPTSSFKGTEKNDCVFIAANDVRGVYVQNQCLEGAEEGSARPAAERKSILGTR